MAQLMGQDTACIAGECAHRLRSGYSGNAIAINTGGVYLPFDAHSAEKLGGLLAGVAAFVVGGREALAAGTDAGAQFLLGHMRN
jgi:hypothetical protein